MGKHSTQARAIVVAVNRHILAHAILALKRFQIATEKCVLVVGTYDPVKLEQLRGAIAAGNWLDIVEVYSRPDGTHPRYSSRFMTRLPALSQGIRGVRALALQYPSVELIVSGVYGGEVDRTLCSLVKSQRVVMVDDGNMTLFTASRRSAEHAAGYRNVLGVNSHRSYAGIRGRVKARLLRSWAGVVDNGTPEVTFFTSHRNLQAGPNDHILVNDYGVGGLSRPLTPGLIHFLGLPAIRRQIFSPGTYARLISSVARFYGDAGKVIYYAHPAESDEERAIVERCWPQAHWQDSRQPYEAEIAQANMLPERLGSFYSSAISNVLAMDIGVACDVFRVAANQFLTAERAAAVSTIWLSLSADVRMVDCNDGRFFASRGPGLGSAAG